MVNNFGILCKVLSSCLIWECHWELLRRFQNEYLAMTKEGDSWNLITL